MLFLGFDMVVLQQKTKFGQLPVLCLGHDGRKLGPKGPILPIPQQLSKPRLSEGAHRELHLGLTRTHNLRVNYCRPTDIETYMILTCRPSFFGRTTGIGSIAVPSTQPIHLLQLVRRDDWYDAVLRAEPGDVFRVRLQFGTRSKTTYFCIGDGEVVRACELDYQAVHSAICRELGIRATSSHLFNSEDVWRDVSIVSPEPLTCSCP